MATEAERKLKIEIAKLKRTIKDLKSELGHDPETSPTFQRLRDYEFEVSEMEDAAADQQAIINQYDEFYDEIRVAATAKTYGEMKAIIFGALFDMEKDFEGPDGQPYVPIPRPSTTA
jgi:hypothetical protein